MNEMKKVIPNKLPREVYRALEAVVGPDYISEDRAIVETYSKYSIIESPENSLFLEFC